MPETKMSAEEMTRYYTRAHQEVLRRDRHDALSAVIAPGASPWVNRFTDFAHRLGMKKAFGVLEGQWGSLGKRSVLDLGCGRGRWSKDTPDPRMDRNGRSNRVEAHSLLGQQF